MQVNCIAGRGSTLGEGPLWDAARGCLWWIDIDGRKLHRYDPISGKNVTRMLSGRPGFAALHTSGQLVLGIERKVVLCDPSTNTGIILAEVDPDQPGNRINDGASDRDGRLWVGTMDGSVAQPSGALYRLSAEGPVATLTGIIASNGPVFSADGSWLFHCDTLRRRILRYPLLPDGGVGVGILLRYFTADEGLPDGLACDTEGGLWVALWGGWCVVRLEASGAVTAQIALPTAQVTACAFGGPELRDLYITTAALGLSADAMSAQPDAGGLFVCRPGHQGLTPNSVQGLLPTLERTSQI